ncbi:hypothetical protein BGZ51_005351 [Haplosporangium sp. Z 767]|nr:hypothetical protein BGZ51_005351 [Haplosporangium sp. Z 767]
MDPEATRRAHEICNALTNEFLGSHLYINGLQEEFMVEQRLDKLEAVSGGARMALTRLEGDLLYYKELFQRSAIDFTEQGTKERFLAYIESDLPLNITHESNQKMEIKAAKLKRDLEEREMNVIELQKEVEDAAEAACRDHDELQDGIFELKKMLTEMQHRERDLVEMRKVDDQFSGMTLEGAQALLSGQTQQLQSLHQELDDLTAEIEELKWQESQLKESNQAHAAQLVQIEAQAKEAVRMSSYRRPEVETAYKECLQATKQYQDGVGLESIQYLADSSSLILEYRIMPGFATIHSINPASAARMASTRTGNKNRRPILTKFLIKIHPASGRLLSVNIEGAGCDVKDVIQMAKTRNDISFLVTETLDRIMKAHP